MSEWDEVEEAPVRRPFTQVLLEQRRGVLAVELADGLSELVAAVRQTGKPGSIVLTLKVAPNKDDVTVTVTDKVKLTLPEGERGAAIFFVDDAGNLLRRDPRQTELPLQGIKGGAGAEAREEGLA